MSTRRKAREVVAQLLFKDNFNPEQQSLESDFIRSRLLNNAGLISFAIELLRGVRDCQDELDKIISTSLQNWELQRVSATDRSILRLGAYEIIKTDTPPAVAVNEAVELGKRFGDKQSFRFINGVLDRIAKDKQAKPVDESDMN